MGLGMQQFTFGYVMQTIGNWLTCLGLGLAVAFVIIGIPNIVTRLLKKPE